MKKIALLAAGAILALVSCNVKEEWEPVFTGKYPNPAAFDPETSLQANITIAELCSKYTVHGKPLENMTQGWVIAGRVSTTDQPGNFYKSFYIQDETGGIEIKIGKNGLYNDYLPGQMIYVCCDGLTLGEYGQGSHYNDAGKKDGDGNGMIQIGFYSPALPSGATGNWYETTYMESSYLINEHVFKGDPADCQPVTPVELKESDLPGIGDTQASNHNIGKLVTLKGMTYDNEVFVLLYPDPTLDHSKDNPENRVFLSDEGTWGIDTWAMSKSKVLEHLNNGDWDNAIVGSGATEFGTILASATESSQNWPAGTVYKDLLIKNAESASVSQYFRMGSRSVIVRTSGYAKFADRKLPAGGTFDITGVLTMYQGDIQLVVNNISDIKVNGKALE